MKLTYSKIDLNHSSLLDRRTRAFSAIERGRKKGADLVVLPMLENEDELRELLGTESGFLRGTLDYPDITIVLGAIYHKKQAVFFVVSEGRIITEQTIPGASSKVILFKDWQIVFNTTNKIIPGPKQFIVSLEPPCEDWLPSKNLAYLFLNKDSVHDRLFYNGTMTRFSADNQAATTLNL